MQKNRKLFGSLFFMLILALGFQLLLRVWVDRRVHRDVSLMVEELKSANMPPQQVQSIRLGLLNIVSDVADPLNSSIFISVISLFNAILIVSFALDKEDKNA